MHTRILVTLIIWTFIAVSTLYAQWSRDDSLKLQRLLQSDGEIKLNSDAVKSIRIGGSNAPKTIQQQSPVMQNNKSHMNFRKDYDLPKHLQKRDPLVNDTTLASSEAEAEKIRINMNIMNAILNNTSGDKEPYKTLPGNMDPSVAPTPGGGNADFDKLLYGIFSKKGRVQKRNRKKATGWKNY